MKCIPSQSPSATVHRPPASLPKQTQFKRSLPDVWIRNKPVQQLSPILQQHAAVCTSGISLSENFEGMAHLSACASAKPFYSAKLIHARPKAENLTSLQILGASSCEVGNQRAKEFPPVASQRKLGAVAKCPMQDYKSYGSATAIP